MRLDHFLRASRLVLRRTVAQELCDAGLVSVNETPARSSRNIRTGDEITLQRRDRILRVRVKEVPTTKQVSRVEAPALYEIISDSKINDE